MISRFYNRNIIQTAHPRMGKTLIRRNRSLHTPHYEGPFFITPDDLELSQIDHVQHTWKHGDRFYKVAQKYYGEPEAWWVIAMYNGIPTEAHVRTGDSIYVPTPLSRVLTIYGF